MLSYRYIISLGGVQFKTHHLKKKFNLSAIAVEIFVEFTQRVGVNDF
jgi:hypothetical protein